MKVVIIDTESSGALIGGAQLFLPQLISRLTDHGHSVHFVSRGTPSSKILPYLDASGAVLEANLWHPYKIVNDSAPKLAEWINKMLPDVVVVSTSADVGWAVLPLLEPVIATVAIGHNDSQEYYVPARHYREFLTRAIGVSDAICENYHLVSGLRRIQVDWIPYGVRATDSEPLEFGNSPLKLVYVGRIEETQKRFADIIAIIKRLVESKIDFHFHVVGDGDSMPIARRELESEIEFGRVILHGWLDGNGVIDIVRESEVFILASGYEGFCISLVEAMANGCAPIVTNVNSGNKQLVTDGFNGFVVPIGDIAGFVDKIRLLSINRARLRDFRYQAWTTGREFSLERMVEAYERSFQQAIEDAGTNPRRTNPEFALMESCRSRYPLWLRRLKAKFMSLLNK